MKRLLTIVLALAIAGFSASAMAAVSGSPHDYSANSAFGLCNPCHVPHAAKMQKRLWQANNSWVDGATWATSNIGRLCGGCHLNGGTLVVAQNNNLVNAHQVTASVYAAASHGRSTTELTGALNDTPAAADNTGRPYLSTWGDATMANKIQCSTCHDPHNNTDVKPFLRAIGGQATISEVCAGCHDRYNATGYGATNAMTRGANDGASVASMHPVNVTYTDHAGNETNGPSDLSKTGNTILRTQAELPAALRTPLVNTEEWRLGGKFEGTDNTGLTGNLGCNTCHAVHGTNDGVGGGVTPDAAATNIYLLAVDNNGANSNAPLCESCHGGNGSTSFTSLALLDGTAGSNGLHYVAGSQLPTVGTYDDHPIDMTPDGVPALVNWANAANARYERVAWGATPAGDPQAAAGHWPYGTQGAYTIGATTFGNIICISCHSAHNGITNTSLRRKGGVAVSGLGNSTANPTAAQMAADASGIKAAWCYNCHQVQDMVPSFHHSTDADIALTMPANYTAGDIPGGGSQAWCGDCHTMGAAMTAHNGFFNLNLILPVTSNGSSGLCLQCHTGTDPVTGFFPPNGHVMSNAGTQSHYLGTFADGAAATAGEWDIEVKRLPWRSVTYKGVATNIYSKYGVTAAAGGTDTHHIVAPAAWSVNQTVVCESCHSVLFNAGWDGTPAGQTNWNVEGGWRTNLLLQLYEDRAPGTATSAGVAPYFAAGARGPADVDGIDTNSGFCVQCHRQTADVAGLLLGSIEAADANLGAAIVPQSMHPMTGWTITRALDSNRAITTLITSDVGLSLTYADAATRPDGGAAIRASYPAANAQDCDSCHRPHNAYGLIPNRPKTGSGAIDSVPAILEVGDNTTNFDLVCVSCHNR